MGLDPATWAIIGSTVLGAGANVFGAAQQGSTNNANLQAQLAHQAMINQYAGRMMQPGMNPFAQQMLNFTKQGLPGAVNGFNPLAQGGAPGGGAPAGSYGGNPTGGGPPTDGGTGGGQGGGGGALQNAYGASPYSLGGQQVTPSSSPYGQYQGQMQYAYQNAFPGVDPSQYSGSTTFGDLLSQGKITQEQLNQFQGQPANYNPLTDPNTLQQYGTYQQQNSLGLPQGLSEQDWYNSYGLPATNIGAQYATNPSQYASYLAGAPSQGNTGYVDQSGNFVPITPGQGSQGVFLQNGQFIDGNGNVLGSAPTNAPGGYNGGGAYLGPGGSTATFNQGTYNPSGAGGQGSEGGGSQGYGDNGQMYLYNSPGAFTYNASTLGQAPTISGSQAFNTGQDPLMQMFQKNLQPSQDPSLMPNLQQINSGNTQFNNSDIFAALQPIQQQQLDKQVGQLHASAGSLGERFGGAMMQNEALLRGQVQNSVNLQNAQIAQSSFENAQNRRLQGLGLSLGNNQNTNQFSLGAAGLQQQAGSGLAGNSLQGQLADQNLLAQYGINNMNSLNSASQFNAGQRTAAGQFTAGQGQQYNQSIMQALAAANNAQQGQMGYNQGLLGIMAGLGVPQAQPSPIPGAIGDAGSSAAMLPLMLSMMRNQGSSYSPYQFQRAQSTYY